MNVLVTGGAGYIGSVLSRQLLAKGHNVTIYDNLSRGFRDSIAQGVRFVHGDILDRSYLGDTLLTHKIDSVVHMAGLIAVGESVREPALYYHQNVTGGLSLLDAMRDAGVKRILFSSTAAVYGEPQRVPIEETDAKNPTNPYGETKWTFEKALRWYGEAFGLHTACLRYFNAAGAMADAGERHEPETHLIPLILRAAAGVAPAITVFGDDFPTRDGTCVRDYIHVLDLAEAHILALEALAKGEKTLVYNLGCGGDGYTVKEVIEVAKTVTGKDVPVKMGARRDGDSAVLVAGSAKIKRELGWQPQHQELGAIIESAWKFMRAFQIK
jgi:UDP-glucose 4-epimerase